MDLIEVEKKQNVALVTLNSPETRNALTDDAMLDAIDATFFALGADNEVKAIVITGSGPAFSSGGNINKLRALSEVGSQSTEVGPLDAINKYRNGVHRIPRAVRAVEVPIIAAVNGPAIGAGLDLALMCDIRLAAESATFAESFVKLGIVSGTGGAWLLPRAIGASKAFEMALTGSAADARTALAFGLVSAVHPDGELLDAALRMAATIARNSGYAVRITKKLLHRAIDCDYDSTLDAIAAFQVLAARSSEHKEAVKRLSDRRKGAEK